MRSPLACLFAAALVPLGCARFAPRAAAPPLQTTLSSPTARGGRTVALFDAEHVFFAAGDDGNRRTVDRVVSLPEPASASERATLRLGLRCPEGDCDRWDRKGYLALVEGDGDDATQIELARFMTPYGVGVDWVFDLSDLRPLLVGDVTLRLFIDTWVGPGHASGAGWLVDADLELAPRAGPPVIAVLPLWGVEEVVYGDPERPTDAQVAVRNITLPAGAGRVELRTLITGHGQGNADNCAEFCPRRHGFRFGWRDYSQLVWRDDCARTPDIGQRGNWKYPRAGWCPGTGVRAWSTDVTEAFEEEEAVEVRYEPEPYVNSCRPGVETCTGCTLGTSCDYDGGRHTEPVWLLSAVLVVYGATTP